MPRRMGRPGLIGAMARTAVITGTATATSRAMNNRANARADQQASAQAYEAQQAQYAQQQQMLAQQQALAAQQQAQQVPAAPAVDDTLTQLQKLGEMRTAGLLTDAEFAAAKAKILG